MTINDNSENLVSCIIPSYKRSDTLRRAVDSVLSQTYPHIEILVVDDNIAGDEYSISLRKIIQEYDNTKVKLVTQPKHINGAEARNAGVRSAAGNYIAFLDDDDEWHPEKIAKQMNFLSSHSEIDGVSCLYSEYSNGVLFHSCPPYNCENIHKKVFQRDVAVFTSTILLRKDALLRSGLFDTNLRRHQDLQLLLDFTAINKMDVLPEYLVKLHSDSAINRPDTQKLITIKQDFFASVAEQLQRYSAREQKEIKAAHYFEIVFSALKEKKIGIALKYLLKVGFSGSAYKNLYNRYKNRNYIANNQ